MKERPDGPARRRRSAAAYNGRATDSVTRRSLPNERLKRAREARNWTQADVASRVGTSPLTVSRWELGVQSPVPHLRGKLCQLFEADPDQLGLLPGASVETHLLPATAAGG